MNYDLNPALGIPTYTPGSYEDLEPSDLLIRLNALRQHCIRVGRAILADNCGDDKLHHILEGLTTEVLLKRLTGANVAFNRIQNHLQTMLGSTNAIAKVIETNKRLLEVLTVDSCELYPLMACKQFIDGYLKSDLSALYGGGNNYDISAGGDITKFVGIGVGSKESEAGGITWATKLFLIPLASYLDAITKAAAPNELPKKNEAMECYLNGHLGTNETQAFLALDNCSWNLWHKVIQAKAEKPAIEQVMKSLKMDGCPSDDVAKYLADHHYVDYQDPELLDKVWTEIPSISDHIHFHQRQVDNFDWTITLGKLFIGFSDLDTTLEAFKELFDSRGMDETLQNAYFDQIKDTFTHLPEWALHRDFYHQFERDFCVNGLRLRDALLHYLTSWKIPSPHELLEFYYKLRPDNIDEWFKNLTGRDYNGEDSADYELAQSILFTKSQLEASLVDSNIAPAMLERFIAAAYRPPGIRFIRQLYPVNAITANDARNWFLQEGFSPSVTDKMIEGLEIQTARVTRTNAASLTPTELQKLWLEGRITTDQLSKQYHELYFPETAIKLVMEKLTHEIKARVAKPAIQAIKRDYLKGYITDAVATRRLRDFVLTTEVIDATIAEWTFERNLALDVKQDQLKDKINDEAKKAIRECYLGNRITVGQAMFWLSQHDFERDNILLQINTWNLERMCKTKLPAVTEMRKAAIAGNLNLGQFAGYLLLENFTPDAVAVEITNILTAEKKIADDKVKALQKALLKQILQQEQTVKHTAKVVFNYTSAVRKAQLTLKDINAPKDQKTIDKALLSEILAAQKEKIDLMPPPPAPS